MREKSNENQIKALATILQFKLTNFILSLNELLLNKNEEHQEDPK